MLKSGSKFCIPIYDQIQEKIDRFNIRPKFFNISTATEAVVLVKNLRLRPNSTAFGPSLVEIH